MNTHAIELARAESLGIFVEKALIGRHAIDKGKKPHPRTLKLSFKNATAKIEKVNKDQTHSFYRGTLTASGNERPLRFTVTRDRDVVEHVMNILRKAAR